MYPVQKPLLTGPEWNAALNEQVRTSGDENRVAFVCWWRALSIVCMLLLEANNDSVSRCVEFSFITAFTKAGCVIHLYTEIDHKGMDADLIEAEKFLSVPLCIFKFSSFHGVCVSNLSAYPKAQSLLDSFSELLGNMLSLSQKSVAQNWKLLERPVALLFSLLRRARLLHVAARVCRAAAPHDLPALHALLRCSLYSLIPTDRVFSHPFLSTRTSPWSFILTRL